MWYLLLMTAVDVKEGLETVVGFGIQNTHSTAWSTTPRTPRSFPPPPGRRQDHWSHHAPPLPRFSDCKKTNVSLVWAISQWNVVIGKYLPNRRSSRASSSPPLLASPTFGGPRRYSGLPKRTARTPPPGPVFGSPKRVSRDRDLYE